MPVPIESDFPLSISAADLAPRGPVYPSPTDWRDQVLYFLLPDRFSDGLEDQRPPFERQDPAASRAPDLPAWRRSGKQFQGGTLRGIASKLDYLKGLGVTTLWVGPVWRQRPDLETYHGYGIQNFLDVDPRFGTRQDLRDLVDAAHARGLYVLLDIIYNHTGNNWFYGNGGLHETLPYRYAPPYPLSAWRDRAGNPAPDVQGVEDGVWPGEFQDPAWYNRAGSIGRWDPADWEDPLHPETEFRRGDFYDLKDLDLDHSPALSALIRTYQYWIALSDCDGFRIDTVKHVSFEASRNFCGAIREYAESIGKLNFWLLGEVTGGGDMTRNYLDIFGRNIDAALDIGSPAQLIAEVTKGQAPAQAFFSQFGGHDILGSHRETGRYHVSILDDHDMVGRPRKARFAAGNSQPARYEQVAHAVGLQLTTLGVPCIYYGTEQAFAGDEGLADPQNDPGFEDRYVRECMFGGAFGAFETTGCHFFDPDHPTYLRIAALSAARRRSDLAGLALRRGRQYLRQTSFLGFPFGDPQPGELAAWSRILHRQEVIVALNTHGAEGRGAEVTVDFGLHSPGSQLQVLYRSDWNDAELRQAAAGNPPVEFMEVRDVQGRAAVRVDLPPAGMVVLG